MHACYSLNGPWQVTWTEGIHGRPEYASHENFDTARSIMVQVPGTIHGELTRIGIIDDPNIGINSLKARWVEEQMWAYRRTFEVPADAMNTPAWINFERLDLNAVVWLNGEEIGRHKTAHRPCKFDVTGKLKEGENLIAVSIESGLYDVAEREGQNYNTAPETLLNKRHWMRKAQYQAGWDWNPRLINVGITGDVTLEWADEPCIDQLIVLPELSDDLSQATLKIRAFINNPGVEFTGTLQVVAMPPGEDQVSHTQCDVVLPIGEGIIEVELDVAEPMLWWPIGQGEQNLYNVLVALVSEGHTVTEQMTCTGIRKVSLDLSKHPVEGEYFIIEVNNRPIFCKGGNWVPVDMMIPDAPIERYWELVDLAAQANFNMLRVWGGGVYVGKDLLKICDEKGMLVWHDLAFACSKYPADDPAFMAEIDKEITWNARDMANHPSLVIWCGNNELEWGAFGWGYAHWGKALPDYSLYHHVIPCVLKKEDPSRPYWPSSPYSPHHEFPNDPTLGDQHPWAVSLGEHGADFWHYREYVDRFPNEGGVLGATSPATLKQCLGDDYCFRSFSWEHHDNSCNHLSVEPGICYKYVDMWLGKDPAQMELEDYLFASSLLQSEGLQEYICNYRRRMYSSSSAIFWMYNDSWPVTHGWTIVDYYLRKKLSFHPVRRAFQPVSVVVAEDEGQVKVFGVNDSPEDFDGVLHCGIFNFAGGNREDEVKVVKLPANCSTVLAVIPTGNWPQHSYDEAGAFAVLSADDITIAQHRLLKARFKNLRLTKNPAITIKLADGIVCFRCEQFVWGATLDLDGESAVPDNCFDLLPGIDYVISWPTGLEVPVILRTGNELVTK